MVWVITFPSNAVFPPSFNQSPICWEDVHVCDVVEWNHLHTTLCAYSMEFQRQWPVWCTILHTLLWSYRTIEILLVPTLGTKRDAFLRETLGHNCCHGNVRGIWLQQSALETSRLKHNGSPSLSSCTRTHTCISIMTSIGLFKRYENGCKCARVWRPEKQTGTTQKNPTAKLLDSRAKCIVITQLCVTLDWFSALT